MKKTILITGAGQGIGFALALVLARMGHRILVHASTRARAEQATEKLQAQLRPGKIGDLVAYGANFLDLAEVREMARRIVANESALDILVNNAGLITPDWQVSKQGVEAQFAVNHLAGMQLWYQLKPLLTASRQGRVLQVSSIGHAGFKQEELFLAYLREPPSGGYSPRFFYYQSKLCNVLAAQIMADEEPSISVWSAHPGIVQTSLSASYMANPVFRWFESLLAIPPEAAATGLAQALLAEHPPVSGSFLKKGRVALKSPLASREDLKDRLQTVTSQLLEKGGTV